MATFTQARGYEFIPKWRDNDKDPNPITFHMRFLTKPERDQVQERKYIQTEQGERRAEVITHHDKAIRLSIERIENLVVEPIGDITDANGFLSIRDPRFDDLYNEIAREISNRNETPDLKN